MEAYIKHGFNVHYEFDQKFNTIVSGNFCYETSTCIDLYDSDGNFFKKEYVYKQEMIYKKDFIDKLGLNFVNHVCQINFDFVILKSKFYSTVDDLQRITWSSINAKIVHNIIDCQSEREDNIKKAQPVEYIGYRTKSYQVNRFLGKKILDFDFEQYNKNRIKAIANNIDEECTINYIFNQNLLMLSYYFMCSIDELKSPKFDIKKQIMKRLNYKIHQKELQIAKEKICR